MNSADPLRAAASSRVSRSRIGRATVVVLTALLAASGRAAGGDRARELLQRYDGTWTAEIQTFGAGSHSEGVQRWKACCTGDNLDATRALDTHSAFWRATYWTRKIT